MPQTQPPDDQDTRRRALGIRIQQLRAWRRLPQHRLAHDAGMAKSTLHRIEHGQGAVTMDRLWALADRLDVDVTVLLAAEWVPPAETSAAAGTWPGGAPPEHQP